MSGQLALGIAAAAAAAACYDAAVVFQAAEVRRTRATETVRVGLLGGLLRRPAWLAATGLSILGWPLQLVALHLAPITIVQPVLALGLLLLLEMGRRMLGERVAAPEVLGAIAIFIGVAMIVIAAPGHSDAHASGLRMVGVLGVLGLAALGPYVLSARSATAMALGAGAAFAAAALTSKLLTDELAASHWIAAAGWVAATAVVAALGLLLEMTALQRASASTVAPRVFIVQIVAPVLAAPIFGHEPWASVSLAGIAVAVGLVTVACGGFALGSSAAVSGIVGAADSDTVAAG